MKRSISTLLLLGLLHATVGAQYDSIALPFRSLSIEDGLSQGMINSMVQDRYGFVWFATKDGLDRFDGYGFRTFRHDPLDPGSLVENYVSVVREALDGRLWVGTATRGVQVFEPRTEGFTAVELPPDAEGAYILDIEFDRLGNTWVSSSSGLYKLGPSPSGGTDHKVTRVIDGQCRIAIGRSGHLWGYRKATTAFRVTPRVDDADLIDTLQVGSWSQGLWSADPRTNVNGMMAVDPWSGRVFGIHPFFIAEYDTVTLEATVIHRMDYPSSTRLEPEDVAIDRQGGLWIGSNECWRFDTRTRRMSRVLAMDPNLKERMNYIGVSFQDRNGLLWFGTLGHGVLRYDPRIERFHTRRLGSVRWMHPTQDGRIIALTRDDVLRVYDPDGGRYTPVIRSTDPHVLNRFPVPRDAVDAVLQDSDGNYWMCMGDLVRFHPGNGRFDVYKVRPSQEDSPWHRPIFPLYMEGEAALWYGNNTVFQRFDRITGRTTDHPYPIPATFSTYSFLQAIHRDEQGAFWLGTVKGLLRFDVLSGEWTHFHHDPSDPHSLGHDLIFAILADPQEPGRYLWIGTNGGGLERFDRTTGRFEHFTARDGLPNNVVYGMVDDAKGRLWLSTNKGIARFDPTTGRSRNFSATAGLQGDEFNRNAFGKLPDGRLFFGGVNGFTHFHPDELEDDAGTPLVRITGVQLINEPVSFRDRSSPLSVPVHLSEGMRIPHSANTVTIEFANMEFAAPEEHRYQYRLDGFDPDWLMAGHRNSATYTNLDPGRYTFRVRSDNRDGLWLGEGAAFTITVLPPWWRTWWFYALCMLAAGAAVLVYVHGQRQQRERLEVMVRDRTLELTLAKERAEHSEKIKQQFLANMSHEIRTPMNAIMGMVGSLRRRPHPPEQDTYLDAIAQSSENLLVIINDILDLAKIEAGKIKLELVPFDPRSIIDHVLDMLRGQAERKGLTLGRDFAAGLPGVLLGDPIRLHQIMTNLVGNAIKFTERGSVSVLVRCGPDHPIPGGDLRLVMDVVDTGIGIAPDMLETIFREFDQAHGDTGRKYGGTGLGLTISKRLVELQGGSITVKSGPAQGSTFTVVLPYRVSEGGRGGNTTAPVNGRHNELRDLSILLVEDNDFNALVAMDELMDAIPGVQVDRARDGRQGVEFHARGIHDLILMDVQMPVMNGYEATRAIRASAGDRALVPIIAMTANVMQVEIDRCLEAGMNAFVPKPFKREELIRAIRAVLEA